ncbi:MBL fold metallo-hydrolase [Vibrio neptunius]|uniref:MBL fold metallo-hydrolase n=1 Tax=Vibrio neptunius TaxID=170651 RepID=UPI0019D311A0|nr:MBL fold metallo-hydrolase [Vibrio neptunius]MBN3573673.1 MBL fold metallo-hydrolase [Vibrio neptunius]QXX09359.1 MBL fold metallo-hydrolase [Vibrio neptunius]
MTTQNIQHFFHPQSGSLSYVVADSDTNEAIVIDPVADYDEENCNISFESAQQIIDHVEQNQLHVTAILETHIHADHLSGSFYLSKVLQAPIYISDHVKEVYASCKDDLSLTDLYHFEHFLLENEQLDFGHSHIEVLETPGHPPSDLTFKIGDALFVGDSHLHSREGSSVEATDPTYESLAKIYELKDSTQVYLCHNEPSSSDELIYKTTLGDELHQQGSVHQSSARRPKLPTPKLISSALEYNLTAMRPPM